MIELSHVNMFFKSELTKNKTHILKDISFSIEQGQILAVLGESGSGKTTLCRILMGLLKPSSGQYLFKEGNPYTNSAAKRYLNTNISVVFQDYNTSVNPRFSVYEIIKEALKIFAKRHKLKLSYQDEVASLLKKVGLDENFQHRFPHQLSGGQLQRVCIARAIASKPKIIFFDEALGALDTHTQVQIMDLLRDLQKELNLTYIFITHDIMSVTYMCSRVLFLHNGQIVEDIPINDLKNTQSAYAKELLKSTICL
ncbi:MAG: ABC transporter ATP-binding protein [Brevinema sp.]